VRINTGGIFGPLAIAWKLWTMPVGPRLKATAPTTSSWVAAAAIAKRKLTAALSLMPTQFRNPSRTSAAMVTSTASGVSEGYR